VGPRMKAVFDTNILIDFLAGHADASATLAGYATKLISRVTWMEVLVGAGDPKEESAIREFLATFQISELTPAIAERAVELRRTHTPRLKLPDAIIYATAKEEACKLVTRNSKDFTAGAPDVSHVTYAV
jgi:predicted nucleic acid-binding protein